MRHGSGHKKLGRTASHRQAMFANMAASLIKHEQIVTTLPKAKALRPVFERLVTLAKKGDLGSRRLVLSRMRDETQTKKLFTLSQLAADGVRASMRPSFPSVTFPNHYTLVTGLHPGRHGLVNNRMEDSQRPGVAFTLQDRSVASDEIWWADGTPIWVTAERQGVRTGTMFWPGSEYEIHGQRPSRYRNFDQSLPGFARTDVLLSWLDLPDAERPRFFTLYFDLVDTAGHRFGRTRLRPTPQSPKSMLRLAVWSLV
ncbi:MAG: 50S ribosomal protein L17 [Caulobacteraceae bacterium]|nr:50S ribosomal protein L17 [Caulobacteraceae bacterium]